MINEKIVNSAVALRKCLHRIPELAGEEVKTCAVIREMLAQIPGVEVLPPFLKTDTVAFIHGTASGKNVTLRADIDALAVPEETGVDFASEHPGKMHACGHDVHTAILYGAAQVLAARRHEFAGSIRLVFQPGEEGKAMAKDLIAAGALTAPQPDFVAALHCEPGLPVGTVGVRAGAMASSNLHFKVVFHGQGGHGSLPHLSRNPISAAVAAYTELQYVLNTRIDAMRPAVVSICTFNGGKNDNVIPDSCEFSGTMRSQDNDTAAKLKAALPEICQPVAQLHRMECEIINGSEYPATVNPASGAETAKNAAKIAGLPVVELARGAMSSEDFAYFLLNSPDGAFVRLGAGEDLPPLHNSKFLPPDEIIPAGIKYMTAVALEALKK